MMRKRYYLADSGRSATTLEAEKPARGGGTREPELRVTLSLRRREPLPDLELGAPGKAFLHATQEALETRYCPREEDLSRVEDFAREAGLQVVATRVAAASVTLKGTPARLARAFGVDLKRYRESSRPFYSHTEEIGLPSRALRDSVRGVLGLNSRPLVTRGAFPRCPVGAGRRASCEDVPERFVAPQIAELYSYPTNGQQLPGQDQCLGLIELEGNYQRSDLKKYFAYLAKRGYRLSIPEIRHSGRAVSGLIQSDFEVTMDLQIAASVCPGACIVIYNAKSSTGTRRTLAAYCEVLERAILDTKHRPSVLSTSWSFPECLTELGPTKQEIGVFEKLFHLARMRKVTICASSGDQGSAFPVATLWQNQLKGSQAQAVDLPVPKYPAASP
ncbi:MAG TPA: protease pro-enzyme activation domain-containing protein, partial [Archangium sp.]